MWNRAPFRVLQAVHIHITYGRLVDPRIGICIAFFPYFSGYYRHDEEPAKQIHTADAVRALLQPALLRVLNKVLPHIKT